MTPGIYPGTPREQYDAIEAINISTLAHGLKSMAHLKCYLDEGKRESNDALRFGQLVHLVVFEPHLVETRVIPAPDCDRRSKENKARWEAFETACEIDGKIGATPEELDTARAIRDAILRDPETRELVDNPGQNELAVIWKDEETGLWCKGMLDRFTRYREWPAVIDLKTTQDCEEWAFFRSIAEHKYHVRAAWYLNGLNTIAPCGRRFLWLAAEKKAPHQLKIYEAEADVLEPGNRAWRRVLNEYAEALKTNHWPTRPVGAPIPAKLPPWAKETA
jgi:exodeoxyribonuclease VIII